MAWKIVAIAALAIFSLAGFAAVITLALTVSTAVYTSQFKTQLLHDAALPAIAIGLATAAFPWQFAGNPKTNSEKATVICGHAMFIGATTCAMSYGIYWSACAILATASNHNHDWALSALVVASWVLAVIGATSWAVGFCGAMFCYCLVISDW